MFILNSGPEAPVHVPVHDGWPRLRLALARPPRRAAVQVPSSAAVSLWVQDGYPWIQDGSLAAVPYAHSVVLISPTLSFSVGFVEKPSYRTDTGLIHRRGFGLAGVCLTWPSPNRTMQLPKP